MSERKPSKLISTVSSYFIMTVFFFFVSNRSNHVVTGGRKIAQLKTISPFQCMSRRRHAERESVCVCVCVCVCGVEQNNL